MLRRTDAQSPTANQIQAFIDRWSPSGGAERANYGLFLSELCDILEVPRPDPSRPDDDQNTYVFDRRVIFKNPDDSESYGYIDLYKRGCFVLESKQGVEKKDDEELLSDASQERKKRRKKGHGTLGSTAWNDTLLRARGQAEQYARALAAPETRPPFLVVVDVGHTIDLYSEFTQTGGTYIPFPNAASQRIKLAQLSDADVRKLLRAVWIDPLSLDPARRSAKVTRDIAASLAKLARSLEAAKHHPHDVAQFLMRCLFTMFAEDVGLLPKKKCFEELLKSIDDPAQFVPLAEDIWRQMNVGGFSVQFRKKLLQFNGGLFEDFSALPVTRDQLDLLIEAAGHEWSDVEPAIFGTLLERALDPVERHKLGAHYTPRAYVERLVMPTIVEPIRTEWDNVRAAAILHAQQGKRDAAVKELEDFHDRLCETRVLDPACGTGNFLYVTLEHLKRIEGEVFSTYESIAQRQMLLEGGHAVDPHQLLGIEINPRAAAIADLVLWIGYLQWHFRTRGNVNPPEPVIKNFKNIECRDALLTWTSREPELKEGKPVTHWDGRTTKPHPVTGEEVPDETAREISYKYNNPKKAEWPKAEYAVGNPPFIGPAKMRESLGDGYVEAIRSTYNDLPESCDYVMYWWHKAAELTGNGQLRQFGFITTNSLRQVFNRRVLDIHLSRTPPISVVYAIPDHPWVDTSFGAAVRISMTVGRNGENNGQLHKVIDECNATEDAATIVLSTTEGKIHANLTTGTPTTTVKKLDANTNLSNRGVCLFGAGFIVSRDEAKQIGLGRIRELKEHIREYRNGRDLTQTSRGVMVIDLFGLEIDLVRKKFPEAYQWIYERVKPERDSNRDKHIREHWWLHGRPRPELREQIAGLARYVATVETAKHRVFEFLPKEVLPDNKLVNIALDDAYYLGILSSHIHLLWAVAMGSTLEDRPVYPKTECFETFPFPDAAESQKSRIRELSEQLDAHRKRQLDLHPKLTMTGMYNVLEKLRAGEPLTTKEQTIHEQGLVSVLRQIHDDLDAAVADAYGWPPDLADEEILARLVALNHERAEEERRGTIRWLRPEFQNPSGAKQTGIAVTEETTTPAAKQKAAAREKQKWPKTLSEQAGAVHAALANRPTGATAKEIAKSFGRPPAKRIERIEEILQTLAALGKARELDDDRYVAV